jgi:4-amino-4-deoxy-L-arabinose transferase-like glycosyltransferase
MLSNRLFETIRRNPGAACVLSIIILLRLVSFGWLAIADPTESRYAEVAKRMYESHDWVTPRLYMQGELVPYWGKPPLHFWLTAASYKLFGVSEWSSRLPSIIAGLIMLFAVFRFAGRLWNSRIAWLATIILGSSGLFFVLWGASVVDVTLSAAVTVAMVSFPLAFTAEKQKKTLWTICLFIALAVATLTKGLVAPAIAVISIGLWWFLQKRPSLRDFPWISGTLLFLLITVPWFVVEELKTPGFLKYFIVNEHLLRFLTHDYGDRYGSGHMYPRGTIWGMLIAMYLPWTIFLASAGYRRWKSPKSEKNTIWFSYVLIWGLTPAIFFTLSRQILGTYLLPGFAGLAIATAVAICKWTDFLDRIVIRRVIYSAALMIPILITAGTFLLNGFVDEHISVKPLFAELTSTDFSGTQVLVFPFYEPPSADFYESRYKSLSVYRSNDPVKQISNGDSHQLIIMHAKQIKNLPITVQNALQLVMTRGDWAIYVHSRHG